MSEKDSKTHISVGEGGLLLWKGRFVEVADEGRKERRSLGTWICGAADFTLDFEMGGRDSFEEIVTCCAET